eukprot:scaffold15663_cov59-Phaeocystis_antarctica.AAC.1
MCAAAAGGGTGASCAAVACPSVWVARRMDGEPGATEPGATEPGAAAWFGFGFGVNAPAALAAASAAAPRSLPATCSRPGGGTCRCRPGAGRPGGFGRHCASRRCAGPGGPGP